MFFFCFFFFYYYCYYYTREWNKLLFIFAGGKIQGRRKSAKREKKKKEKEKNVKTKEWTKTSKLPFRWFDTCFVSISFKIVCPSRSSTMQLTTIIQIQKSRREVFLKFSSIFNFDFRDIFERESTYMCFQILSPFKSRDTTPTWLSTRV